MTQRKVALVLGGGGARGLAHIGVLRALAEHGVPIDMVAGTSFGALVGGLYASGLRVEAIERAVRTVNKTFIAKVLSPSLTTSGLVKGDRVRHYLKSLIGDACIEHFAIPFAAIATDLGSGEELVLNSGPAVEAIMASIAIPVMFKPVLYQNRYVIDGGLVNPLPVSAASALGADVVIAVNVHPHPANLAHKQRQSKAKSGKQTESAPSQLEIHREPTPPHSLLAVLTQSIVITENNLLMARLNREQPDILISPDCSNYDFLGFHRAEELIEVGKRAAIKALPEIAKFVP